MTIYIHYVYIYSNIILLCIFSSLSQVMQLLLMYIWRVEVLMGYSGKYMCVCVYMCLYMCMCDYMYLCVYVCGYSK